MDSFLSEMGRDSRTELFTGRGEMGERIRAFAWSTTPLGPVDQWPENLLTLVATSLRSRFPIVIWWDRRHYTMLYNDAYIPFLGKTKHPGWLGQSGRDCWSEIWPTIGPMLESVFETGESTWSEDLLLVLDRNLPREEAYFTFSYSAIPGAYGEAEGIFCACTETTERVIGERRLRTLRDLASRSLQARSAEEACEFAARLFDQNATDIPFALVYLLDRDQRVAQLVAYSGLSLSVNPLAKDVVLSPPNGEKAPWPLAEVGRTGKSVLISLPDGAYALSGVGPWPEPPEQALVLPLKEPSQNQVTGFLVVGANPRRMLDEAYKDFFQLVAGHVATAVANARAYEEERRRAEALAEVDRAKTLFFSNISHEFRTPLALMLGPIEDMLAEAPTLSSTQYQRAEMLHRNTLRILKLVNTLLDFSRIEAGRAEAVYEPTDLAILTADLASSFRSVMEKAGLCLTVKCPPLDAPIYVDRQMWENIVLNLLSNAFKYTLEGEITVTLEQRETTVELSVKDTGVGIPAEELPHMFERFHRVRGTAGRTIEGTGIGLSLVQELVKLHAGTISVSSVHGQGSTFTVSLPLGSAHLPQDRISTHRADIALGANVSFYVQEASGLLTGQEDGIGLLADRPLNSKSRQPERETEQPEATILFADDNADMREYVRRLLQQRYRVQTVSNGREALAAAKKQRPDLILTDVMMPHMDGFALLKALRAEQATASIPVILLSARAGEEATLDGLQAGANDYLVKPFSAREMLARVQAQLEITRLRREAELAREHLYSLLMQAPAGICVLRGKEHIFELANPPYCQLVGERELPGKAVREALPEMEEQGFFEQLDQVYRTGEPLVGNEVPTQLRRGPDGSVEEAYFNFVYQPIRTARGEVEGIMVHAVEVTEQVHARRRVDTFLGIASHELKNPLTSIKGNVELAQRRLNRALGEAAQQEDMQQLLDSVSLMLTRASRQIDFQNRLVSDLVDSTRIQVGKLELRREPADLTAIVCEAVEEQRQLFSTRVIHLELRVDDGQCVNVDSNRIGQVVTNYLSNALKYSEEGQSVEVRVETWPTELRVAVQDQGPGLSEEEQAHIWERFYRAPGVQVKSGSGIGLGLGLHICQTIIEQHGGRVGVESKKGEGATFWFTLPRGPLPA